MRHFRTAHREKGNHDAIVVAGTERVGAHDARPLLDVGPAVAAPPELPEDDGDVLLALQGAAAPGEPSMPIDQLRALGGGNPKVMYINYKMELRSL